MSIGKKEIILISILMSILYLFIGYMVFWEPGYKEYSDKESKLDNLMKQRQEYIKEYANIGNYKAQLLTNSIQIEKIETVILPVQNVTDGIEFFNKFEGLFKGKISKMSIGNPTLKKDKNVRNSKDTKSDQTKNIFEMKLNFESNTTFAETLEIINYLESGTQKVVVNNVNISSKKDDKKSVSTTEQIFTVKYSAIMYSSSIQSTNKIDEWSRHKFNKYFDEDGNPTVISSQNSGISLPSSSEALESLGTSTKTISLDDKDISKKKIPTGNISIHQDGFLIAGDNFNIKVSNNPNEKISLKTNEHKDIFINFDDTYYSISTLDDFGARKSISGNLAEFDDYKITVKMMESKALVDKKSGLSIYVTNNSNKNIDIAVEDKSGKVKIFDRSNNEITGGNKEEKIIRS